jgi:hypothetical protein
MVVCLHHDASISQASADVKKKITMKSALAIQGSRKRKWRKRGKRRNRKAAGKDDQSCRQMVMKKYFVCAFCVKKLINCRSGAGRAAAFQRFSLPVTGSCSPVLCARARARASCVVLVLDPLDIGRVGDLEYESEAR